MVGEPVRPLDERKARPVLQLLLETDLLEFMGFEPVHICVEQRESTLVLRDQREGRTHHGILDLESGPDALSEARLASPEATDQGNDTPAIHSPPSAAPVPGSPARHPVSRSTCSLGYSPHPPGQVPCAERNSVARGPPSCERGGREPWVGDDSSLRTAAVFLALMLTPFGLPIPEDVSLLAAGILTATGHASLLHAVVIGYLGVLGGDVISWTFGRRVGLQPTGFIARLVGPEDIARIERFYDRYGSWAIIIARQFPGMRLPAFFFAGASGISLPRFLALDGTAAIVTVGVFVSLGRIFADDLVPSSPSWTSSASTLESSWASSWPSVSGGWSSLHAT